MTFDPIYDGKDLIGRALTGMGKTLAFALPTIERVCAARSGRPARGRAPAVLAMAPTRELAKQVAEDFESCSPGLETLTVYGGTPMHPQRAALQRGVDVVVGTPGRIKDLMEQGCLRLDSLTHAILDEADRMLDMGFADEVSAILDACPALLARRLSNDKNSGRSAKRMRFDASGQAGEAEDVHAGASSAAAADAAGADPSSVQVLLFSATLPNWVKEVAAKYMINPESADLVGDTDARMTASKHVEHLVLQCPWQTKAATIGDVITAYSGPGGRVIIFCETKRDVNDLCVDPGIRLECKPLHGDVAQSQRETTLEAFKTGRIRCIVATDVAARGLDIKGVDLVIMERPPAKMSGRPDIEAYVHRSGRTGRAGRAGTCITLYTRSQEGTIKEIEATLGNTFTRIGAPQPADLARASAEEQAARLDDVDEEAADLFKKPALAAASKYGADGALRRALAVMAGYTSALPNRSLLSSSEGFTTILWSSNGTEIHSPGYVWSGLRRDLSDETCNAVRGLRITADGMAAVFDVPEANMPEVKALIEGGAPSFSIATKLPEFRERPDAGRGGGRGGRGGFGGRGGGRGGFGGRGGGRSFSRGRGGGRGRGRGGGRY